eukprot:TRINITY_DN10293_c0_g1_i1.p1 TRINITY_DN10293_c0_g1~~TRINITY_DN10293_c0_g1_i1.p1  ORF type:complete len:431 (+),score=88.91 TRINITY_DN10293_c0_g1_i1:205-1497(+)
MEGSETKSRRKDDEKKQKKKRLHVEMESVAESKNKIAPFVGYFPSGFDPLKHCKLENGEVGSEDPEIRVFRNEKFQSRLQLVVSPKGSNVEFVGSSHSGEAAAPQVCTYAIGILDKEKQSLRIVPITANKIFRLEPRVRGEPHELNEELPTEKSAARMRDLTNLYGTKSAKTQIRKWDLMRTNEGNADAKNIIEGMVEDFEINKESLETTIAHVGNIPPHDVTATSPENAYPLDKIILKGEWSHLVDILELTQLGDAASAVDFCQKNNYPSFVCNRLDKLWRIQDEGQKSKIAGIFSYIGYLLMFKNLPYNIQNSKPTFNNAYAKHHGIPVTLFQKFDKMFGNSDSEAVRMLDEKCDLLIGYILVLTLFADGFKTSISDIASDLKMTPMNLRRYYQILGCKLSSAKRVVTVTLPVPLKLPELTMRNKKRR